jgi:hypothetical protein
LKVRLSSSAKSTRVYAKRVNRVAPVPSC